MMLIKVKQLKWKILDVEGVICKTENEVQNREIWGVCDGHLMVSAANRPAVQSFEITLRLRCLLAS